MDTCPVRTVLVIVFLSLKVTREHTKQILYGSFITKNTTAMTRTAIQKLIFSDTETVTARDLFVPYARIRENLDIMIIDSL